MLNPELTKEIRSRGFPAPAPTLEQLIDACEPFFSSLVDQRMGNPKVDMGEMNFLANSWKYVDENLVRGNGRTAQDAVANLWLAINVKKYA